MGLQQSSGTSEMTREEMLAAFKFPDGINTSTSAYRADALSRYTPLTEEDLAVKTKVQAMLLGGEAKQAGEAKAGFTPYEDRCVAVVLGLAIGDSLGSPMEFSPCRYGVNEMQDLEQLDVWNNPRYNRFGLQPGQWTDDTSMSLCLADSLLVSRGLKPHDLRLRFLNWWRFGYRNAFGYDDYRRGRKSSGAGSVGLGGNISTGMTEFTQDRTEYTEAGDENTCGNGSIMRLGPCPVFYASNLKLAEEASYCQSKTTHQGHEAAECCRLLAHVIVTAINHASPSKDILANLPATFSSDVYSIQCLAASRKEDPHPDNKDLQMCDRDWNWKNPEYKYAPIRASKQPGYIGSYAMDGLAMALHCIWTTSSFKEAVLKCANIRGDADTVTAVVGQMAGAIYGTAGIPRAWIECVQKWDNGGDLALLAYRLCHVGKEVLATGSNGILASTQPTRKVSAPAAASSMDTA